MTKPLCANSRLLLAILKAPETPPAIYHRSQTPVAWVRTITSLPYRSRNPPPVSFGDDADAVLAEYASKDGSASKAISEKRRRTSDRISKHNTASSSQEATALIELDGYEISNFIDRSSRPLHQQSRVASRLVPKDNAEPVIISTQHEDGKRKRENAANPTVGKYQIKADGAVRDGTFRKKRDPWMTQKTALKDKFPDGWSPRKKLSPDAMEGIRGLHQQDPNKYTTSVLAEQFKTSPEAIRRILKSKWMTKQAPEKMDERRERWARRHDRIWDRQAELGLRPQRRKDAGVEDPDKFEQDMERKRILREM